MNALMKDMRTVRAWSIRMEEEMAKALALLDDRPPSEKNALLGVRRSALTPQSLQHVEGRSFV